MPRHGDMRGRALVEQHRSAPFVFLARNGEGACVIPKVTIDPAEQRYCAKCRKWIRIVGVLALLQADWVGCLQCGKPFPESSRVT